LKIRFAALSSTTPQKQRPVFGIFDVGAVSTLDVAGAQLINVDAPVNIVAAEDVVEGFDTSAKPVPVVIPGPHDAKHRRHRSS